MKKIKNYIDGVQIFNDESTLYYSCKTCKSVWEIKNKDTDNNYKSSGKNQIKAHDLMQASIVENLTERMIVSPKIDDLYIIKDLILAPKIILKKIFDKLKNKYPDRLRTIYEKDESMHYYIEELISIWYKNNF